MLKKLGIILILNAPFTSITSQETISISKEKSLIAAELIEKGKGAYKEAKLLRREKDSLNRLIGNYQRELANVDSSNKLLRQAIDTIKLQVKVKDSLIIEKDKMAAFYRKQARGYKAGTIAFVLGAIFERVFLRRWLNY